MSGAISRERLLAAGGRRAIATALVVGSLGAAGCGRGMTRAALVPTPAAALDDEAIAQILASAEFLAIDFYRRALAVSGFSPTQGEYLRSALANERAHLQAIAAARGGDVPERPRFAYPPGTFASVASVVRTGVALEQAFLGSYLGAVSELRDPALRSLAGRIAANEAQHLQGLTSFDSSGPGTSASLPVVLTTREAASIVAPFLA